jgi:hypothetical protein
MWTSCEQTKESALVEALRKAPGIQALLDNEARRLVDGRMAGRMTCLQQLASAEELHEQKCKAQDACLAELEACKERHHAELLRYHASMWASAAEVAAASRQMNAAAAILSTQFGGGALQRALSSCSSTKQHADAMVVNYALRRPKTTILGFLIPDRAADERAIAVKARQTVLQEWLDLLRGLERAPVPAEEVESRAAEYWSALAGPSGIDTVPARPAPVALSGTAESVAAWR